MSSIQGTIQQARARYEAALRAKNALMDSYFASKQFDYPDFTNVDAEIQAAATAMKLAELASHTSLVENAAAAAAFGTDLFLSGPPLATFYTDASILAQSIERATEAALIGVGALSELERKLNEAVDSTANLSLDGYTPYTPTLASSPAVFGGLIDPGSTGKAVEYTPYIPKPVEESPPPVPVGTDPFASYPSPVLAGPSYSEPPPPVPVGTDPFASYPSPVLARPSYSEPPRPSPQVAPSSPSYQPIQAAAPEPQPSQPVHRERQHHVHRAGLGILRGVVERRRDPPPVRQIPPQRVQQRQETFAPRSAPGTSNSAKC